ncbi:hypothetical protein HDU96_007670 [Phlyctochytrium bullatum]|nr:hypothetical protein HDU96_007670 [Phlyctochytrium bullatum]
MYLVAKGGLSQEACDYLRVPLLPCESSRNVPVGARRNYLSAKDRLSQYELDDQEDALKDGPRCPMSKRACFAIRFALRNDARTQQFDLEAIIGFGGFGVVLLVRPRLNSDMAAQFGVSPLALKICYRWYELSHRPPVDRDAIRTNARDTELLKHASASKHPNIVEYLDSWEDCRQSYVLMELVNKEFSLSSEKPLTFLNRGKYRYEKIPFVKQGGDLFCWVEQMMSRNLTALGQPADDERSFPPLVLVRGIFVQAVLGTAACHANGIAHCDLKPDNFLLSATNVDIAKKVKHLSRLPSTVMAELAAACSPTVKVCDFGVATQGSPPPPVERYGTHAYCAPELQANFPWLGTSLVSLTDAYTADIFALGLTLLVMLQGWQNMPKAFLKARECIPGLTEQELQSGLYPYKLARTDLGQDGEDLLARMLTTRPERRPTIFQILDHPWVKEVLDAAETRRVEGKSVFGDAVHAAPADADVVIAEIIAQHFAATPVACPAASPAPIKTNRSSKRAQARARAKQQRQRQALQLRAAKAKTPIEYKEDPMLVDTDDIVGSGPTPPLSIPGGASFSHAPTPAAPAPPTPCDGDSPGSSCAGAKQQQQQQQQTPQDSACVDLNGVYDGHHRYAAAGPNKAIGLPTPPRSDECRREDEVLKGDLDHEQFFDAQEEWGIAQRSFSHSDGKSDAAIPSSSNAGSSSMTVGVINPDAGRKASPAHLAGVAPVAPVAPAAPRIGARDREGRAGFLQNFARAAGNFLQETVGVIVGGGWARIVPVGAVSAFRF